MTALVGVASCGVGALWYRIVTGRIGPLWVLVPLVCVSAAALALSDGLFGVSPLWLGFTAGLLCLLMLCALSDAETQGIPDAASALLAVLGAGMLAVTGAPWMTHLATAAAVFAIFLLRGVMGPQRRMGIGDGDLLMIAALALWLGPRFLCLMVGVAACLQLCLWFATRWFHGAAGSEHSGPQPPEPRDSHRNTPGYQPFAPALAFSTIGFWTIGG